MDKELKKMDDSSIHGVQLKGIKDSPSLSRKIGATPMPKAGRDSPAMSSEDTPLYRGGEKGKEYSKLERADTMEESIDFFRYIEDEIKRINGFYVGKLAEIKVLLEDIVQQRSNSYRLHHTSGQAAYLLKLRGIYVDLMALKAYSDLNRTGFYKIIKKHDKTMKEDNMNRWMANVSEQPFTNITEIERYLEVVTSLVSRDKLIEWDRFASTQTGKNDERLFPSVRWAGLLVSCCIFVFSLFICTVPANDMAANRCMSILLFTISLWVTEALPYFATALLVPILVTMMGVLKRSGTYVGASNIMAPEEAATFVLSSVFNHTTMLILGGYTISCAFARCQLELRIASILQNRFGANPKVFILAVMFVGLFLSMWIGNHTAPILCSTIILPIVRDLPSDSKFSKTLLLGLAYACNFGGMMTPISSMQNILAVSSLEASHISVSFGRWMCVSIPFCLVCTVLAWLFLLMVLRPDDIKSIPVVVHEDKEIFTRRNVTVISLTLLVILFFAFFQYLRPWFGDIGILALAFVAFMFGSGMLSEVDFNSLSWHTLFLIGGGNVLGKAIQSSGLLGYLSDAITMGLPLNQPWIAYFIVLGFAACVANFISHTVASLILMPIILSIGVSLSMPKIVVIGSAFAVSAAMGLPFSSFPNVNSLLLVDDFQRAYLTTKDFILTGVPLTIISLVLIATLGSLLIDVVIT